MAIPQPFSSYLDEHHLPYERIHHHRDYTAQETAADTHTKGRDFAKTVVLWVDNKFCMAVIPATCAIDLSKVAQFLGVSEVKLASEDEIKSLCPNCEVGAMPPFGELYGLPVYISHLLTYDHLITFKAGTHEDVIRMPYRDFDEMVKPKVFDFTRQVRN